MPFRAKGGLRRDRTGGLWREGKQIASPSIAYSLAVKAVEDGAIPVVSPKDTNAGQEHRGLVPLQSAVWGP